MSQNVREDAAPGAIRRPKTPGSAGTFILAPAFHAVNEFALRSAVEAFRSIKERLKAFR
jgi:hypothetical protein